MFLKDKFAEMLLILFFPLTGFLFSINFKCNVISVNQYF